MTQPRRHHQRLLDRLAAGQGRRHWGYLLHRLAIETEVVVDPTPPTPPAKWWQKILDAIKAFLGL